MEGVWQEATLTIVTCGDFNQLSLLSNFQGVKTTQESNFTE